MGENVQPVRSMENGRQTMMMMMMMMMIMIMMIMIVSRDKKTRQYPFPCEENRQKVAMTPGKLQHLRTVVFQVVHLIFLR